MDKKKNDWKSIGSSFPSLSVIPFVAHSSQDKTSTNPTNELLEEKTKRSHQKITKDKKKRGNDHAINEYMNLSNSTGEDINNDFDFDSDSDDSGNEEYVGQRKIRRKLLKEATELLRRVEQASPETLSSVTLLNQYAAIGDASGHDNSTNSSWSLDKRGDQDALLYGSSYRMDVPVYAVLIHGRAVSSNQIALQAYQRPTGLIELEQLTDKFSSTTGTRRIHSRKNEAMICDPTMMRLRFDTLRRTRYISATMQAISNEAAIERPMSESLAVVAMETDRKHESTTNVISSTTGPVKVDLAGYGTILRYDIPASSAETEVISTLPTSSVVSFQHRQTSSVSEETTLNPRSNGGLIVDKASTQFIIPFSTPDSDDLQVDAAAYLHSLATGREESAFVNGNGDDNETTSMAKLIQESPYQTDSDLLQNALSTINKTAHALLSAVSVQGVATDSLLSLSTVLGGVALFDDQNMIQRLSTAQASKSDRASQRYLSVIRTAHTQQYNQDICKSKVTYIERAIAYYSSSNNSITDTRYLRWISTLQLLHLRLSQQLLEPNVFQDLWKKSTSDSCLSEELHVSHSAFHRSLPSVATLSEALEFSLAKINDYANIARNKEASRRLADISADTDPMSMMTYMRSAINASLPVNLLHDIFCLQIDEYIRGVVLMHMSNGYQERGVALIQALFEMNIGIHSSRTMACQTARPRKRRGFDDISTDRAHVTTSLANNSNIHLADVLSTSPVELFEQFWESEFPRVGDPLQYHSDNIKDTGGNIVSPGLNRGIQDWLLCQSPSVEQVAPLITSLTQSSHDDTESLLTRLLDLTQETDGNEEMSLRKEEFMGSNNNQELKSKKNKNKSGKEDKKSSKKKDKKEKKEKARKRNHSNPVNDDNDDSSRDSDSDSERKHIHSSVPIAIKNNLHYDNVTLEDGYQLIYSRVHGYRIKVKVDEDSALPYKKILGELSPELLGLHEGDDVAALSADDLLRRFSSSQTQHMKQKRRQLEPKPDLRYLEQKTRQTLFRQSQLMQDINTTSSSSTSSSLSANFNKETVLERLQWRPLRANLTSDSKAATQQPDRVAFTEDLKPYLLHIDTKGMPYSQLSSVFARIIIRSMQALGVCFPHANHSHGLFTRSISTQLTTQDGGFTQSLLLDRLRYLPSDPSHIRHQTSIQSFIHRMLNPKLVHTELLSLLAYLENSSLVSDEMLSDHCRCASLGVESKVDFLIRYLQDCITMCGHEISLGSAISWDFFVDLHCALITIKTSVFEAISKESVNTHHQVLRDESRLILERFQGLLEKLQSSSVTSQASQRDMNMSMRSTTAVCCDLPQSMDLRVWCAYLRMELSGNQYTEAFKVGDKLLKTLTSIQPNSDYTTVPGAYELHWVLTRQILGLTTQHSVLKKVKEPSLTVALSVTSDLLLESFIKACRLLLCASQTDTYDGFLKPVAADKKKVSFPLQWLESGLSSPGAMQSISQYRSIMDGLLRQLTVHLNTVYIERKTEQSIGAVRFHAVACSRINYSMDLYYVTVMLAYSQFLSTTLLQVKQVDIELSECDPASAIATSDAVFKTMIHSLRKLLFSSSTSMTETDITNDGVAVSEMTGGLSFSSEVEVSILVCLEQLHSARVQFHVFARSLLTHITASRGTSVYDQTQSLYSNRLHSVIWMELINPISSTDYKTVTNVAAKLLSSSSRGYALKAVSEGLREFPLSSSLLHAYLWLELSESSGIGRLRSYFKQQPRRVIWGGGLQPLEACFLLLLEMCQADKTVLLTQQLSNLDENITNSVMSSIFLPTKVQLNNTSTRKELLLLKWDSEMCERIRVTFEWLLSDPELSRHTLLWRVYMHFTCIYHHYTVDNMSTENQAVRSTIQKLFYRASQYCQWDKSLWLSMLGPLSVDASTDSGMNQDFIVWSQKHIQLMQERGFGMRLEWNV